MWDRTRQGASVVLTLLLLGLTGAVVIAWIRGLDIACGCFGGEESINYPVKVAQNLGLILWGAVLFFLSRSDRPPQAPRRHREAMGRPACDRISPCPRGKSGDLLRFRFFPRFHGTPFQQQIEKAAVLVEALPYLQQFRGHTFLIKVGGSAMDDPELVKRLLRDVVFMEVAGINPVLVHGGGKAISAAMKEAGLDAEFVGASGSPPTRRWSWLSAPSAARSIPVW